jgi:hypothetical protein
LSDPAGRRQLAVLSRKGFPEQHGPDAGARELMLHFPSGEDRDVADSQVPYLKDSNHHDFGHIINKFRFAADMDDAQEKKVIGKEMMSRTKLGIMDPLYGVKAHTEECELIKNATIDPPKLTMTADYMFQCTSANPLRCLGLY